MVVVSPFMWRHNLAIVGDDNTIMRAERFRRVCTCGWKSLPYEPSTRGRAAAKLEGEHHLASCTLLFIEWDIE